MKILHGKTFTHFNNISIFINLIWQSCKKNTGCKWRIDHLTHENGVKTSESCMKKLKSSLGMNLYCTVHSPAGLHVTGARMCYEMWHNCDDLQQSSLYTPLYPRLLHSTFVHSLQYTIAMAPHLKYASSINMRQCWWVYSCTYFVKYCTVLKC